MTRTTYRCLLASSLLLSACEPERAEALRLFHALLRDRRRDTLDAAVAAARERLHAYCAAHEPDARAPAELAQLVCDVAARFTRKRAHLRALAASGTYGALAAALVPPQSSSERSSDEA